MRFTSLIVELIRARPALIFWVVALAQALVWILIPTALYSSPPGDVALTLAYGREYLLSDVQGPPLAYWLADIAFRAGGNSLFGVFVLSQLCFIAAFWSMFRLGSAILGPAHAAIAMLLGVTITAFSFPNVAFGPQALAQPFWAALLLNFWRIVGEGQRKAWFAFSLHAGLLILTTIAALPLLAMLGAGAAIRGAGSAHRRARPASRDDAGELVRGFVRALVEGCEPALGGTGRGIAAVCERHRAAGPSQHAHFRPHAGAAADDSQAFGRSARAALYL
jgi:hypothetical protein